MKKINLQNAKRFLVQLAVVVVLVVISFIGGCVWTTYKYNKSIFDLKQTIESLQQKISSVTAQAEEFQVNLANAISEIALKDEVIKEYKAKESVDVAVEEIRDVNIALFKEAKVKINYSDQTPIAVLSEKYSLNPEKFGYLSDVQEELVVKYFFGAVANKINVENDSNTVEITYGKDAFVNPYSVISRSTDLNAGAKILTNYGDDKTVDLINDVGRDLLSKTEDLYISELKEKYSESEIPVIINGKKLQDWGANDKIFVVTNSVNGCAVNYSVQ